MKKTILFIMPRLPFPTSSGRKTSLYHYCRILSERLGYHLVVAAFLEEGDDPTQKPDFIDRLVVLPSPSGTTKIKNLLLHSFIKRRMPMQVSLYWNPAAKRIIDRLILEEAPEIVIGDMVRSTEYIRDIKTFRIADLDDRLSLRYQRQLEADIDSVNPYGAYINSIPPLLRKVLLSKIVKLFVIHNEIELLKKYEIRITKECDCTILVAQCEADKLNEEVGENKAVAVPIGVDTEYFQNDGSSAEEDYICFVGAMSVAHNENAVQHFVNDILPAIIQKCPQAKLIVVGGGVSEKLRAFESQNVHFAGFVNDVRDVMRQCKVFACPMTFGSGIKTKILEAMSMGMPVVTTSIGAENIGARDCQDWVIANECEKFASKICNLLQDENMRCIIGKNAREFIESNWTWSAAEETMKLILPD